jgi:HEAT repeat protein
VFKFAIPCHPYNPQIWEGLSLEEAVSILGEALRSESYWARSAAGTVLAALGPQAHAALPVLVTAMKEAKEADAKADAPGSGYGIAIATALGRIAPQAPLTGPASDQVIAALSEGLTFKAPGIRSECAAALGKLGPRAAGALPGLRSLLEDKVRQVREEAASALEKIGPRFGLISESTSAARQ